MPESYVSELQRYQVLAEQRRKGVSLGAEPRMFMLEYEMKHDRQEGVAPKVYVVCDEDDAVRWVTATREAALRLIREQYDEDYELVEEPGGDLVRVHVSNIGNAPGHPEYLDWDEWYVSEHEVLDA